MPLTALSVLVNKHMELVCLFSFFSLSFLYFCEEHCLCHTLCNVAFWWCCRVSVGKLPDDHQRSDAADSGQIGVPAPARCASGIRRGTFLFLIQLWGKPSSK